MLRVRGLLAASICLGLVGAAAAQDKKDAKPAIDKDKIVGNWIIVKGPSPAGATLEFTKDGKLINKFKEDGKTIIVEGSYKIDGEKLLVTTKSPSGKDELETGIIKVLTADRLLLDDQGKEIEFKRAPEKKPMPK